MSGFDRGGIRQTCILSFLRFLQLAIKVYRRIPPISTRKPREEENPFDLFSIVLGAFFLGSGEEKFALEIFFRDWRLLSFRPIQKM